MDLHKFHIIGYLYLSICYLIQNPSKKKKGANRKMKITFNDGRELQIQQVTEQTDGALLIKTISAHEDQLKTLFSDQTTTKRMSVSERDADTVVYENYTKLDAIVKVHGRHSWCVKCTGKEKIRTAG